MYRAFQANGTQFWTLLGLSYRVLRLSRRLLTPSSAAGLCYLIEPDVENSTARIAAVATFVYLFAAFYSPGGGPVVRFLELRFLGRLANNLTSVSVHFIQTTPDV